MPEEILYIYTQVADCPKRQMSQGIFEGDPRYWKLTGKGGGWVQTRNRYICSIDRYNGKTKK